MIRSFTVAALMCFAALPAAAQSVTDWQPRSDGFSSVEIIRCGDCAAPEATAAPDMVRMHEEAIRIFEADGEMLVARTDDMMGGSPVTTISHAEIVFGPRVMTARSLGAGEMPQPAIDHQARTSSLEAGMAVEELELRLN